MLLKEQVLKASVFVGILSHCDQSVVGCGIRVGRRKQTNPQESKQIHSTATQNWKGIITESTNELEKIEKESLK